MKLETIRSEISPRGIATLTLNRPDKLNAFNQMMLGEVAAQIARYSADDRVRVVVLRAAGKHFSAGADMERPAGADAEVKHTGFIDIFRAIDACPKPTIAVLNGACVGGAAALVACCDLLLAAETAFLSIPEVRIGVSPVGVTPVLVRAMGIRNYRRYALSGERIPAPTAMRIGLVDEVCSADTLEHRLEESIEAFLLGGPLAMASLKEHLRRAYPGMSAEIEAAHEHHARVDTFRTPEALEGVAAFLAQRKPSWYPAR